MTNDQLINEAICLFHELEQDAKPLGPGCIIAHKSDPYTYEVREISGRTVTGFYIDRGGQEHVASFPLDEVFSPGKVKEIASWLQQKHREHAAALN